MASNHQGGLKAAVTNKKRHGKDFYKRIGALGGKSLGPEKRHWAQNKKAASIAGRVGGSISKRKPASYYRKGK